MLNEEGVTYKPFVEFIVNHKIVKKGKVGQIKIKWE